MDVFGTENYDKFRKPLTDLLTILSYAITVFPAQPGHPSPGRGDVLRQLQLDSFLSGVDRCG